MHEPDLKQIGERMQLIRKKLNFLQKDFARELGISGGSLSEIEAGLAKPRFELFYNLTSKFNVNIYFLLHGDGKMFMSENSDPTHQLDSATYGYFVDWLKKFLYYFRKSELVRYKVMSFFSTYLLEHEELIEKDIDRNKPEIGETGDISPPPPPGGGSSKS